MNLLFYLCLFRPIWVLKHCYWQLVFYSLIFYSSSFMISFGVYSLRLLSLLLSPCWYCFLLLSRRSLAVWWESFWMTKYTILSGNFNFLALFFFYTLLLLFLSASNFHCINCAINSIMNIHNFKYSFNSVLVNEDCIVLDCTELKKS